MDRSVVSGLYFHCTIRLMSTRRLRLKPRAAAAVTAAALLSRAEPPIRQAYYLHLGCCAIAFHHSSFPCCICTCDKFALMAL